MMAAGRGARLRPDGSLHRVSCSASISMAHKMSFSETRMLAVSNAHLRYLPGWVINTQPPDIFASRRRSRGSANLDFQVAAGRARLTAHWSPPWWCGIHCHIRFA